MRHLKPDKGVAFPNFIALNSTILAGGDAVI